MGAQSFSVMLAAASFFFGLLGTLVGGYVNYKIMSYRVNQHERSIDVLFAETAKHSSELTELITRCRILHQNDGRVSQYDSYHLHD